MAGLDHVVAFSGVTGSGSQTPFIEIICAANTRLRLKEVSYMSQGISVTDAPIRLELNLVTTAGVTPVAATPQNTDRDVGLTVRSVYNTSWATDPVAGAALRNWMVHPQSGLIYPTPDEDLIILSITDTLGYVLRVVSPGVSVNCEVYMEFEE